MICTIGVNRQSAMKIGIQLHFYRCAEHMKTWATVFSDADISMKIQFMKQFSDTKLKLFGRKTNCEYDEKSRNIFVNEILSQNFRSKLGA